MKSGYRGLGSIDFTAAARSILVVGRIQDEPAVRIIAQSKNSLAPEGKSIAFELDPEHGFQWKGACEITVDELLSGGGQVQTKLCKWRMNSKDAERRWGNQCRGDSYSGR